jgi:hypothetical protein
LTNDLPFFYNWSHISILLNVTFFSSLRFLSFFFHNFSEPFCFIVDGSGAFLLLLLSCCNLLDDERSLFFAIG